MKARGLRTLTLWSGTLLCVLIAAAFVVSGWWAIMLQLGPVAVYVMGGNVTVLLDDPFVNPITFDQHSHGLSRWAAFARSDGSGSWPYWVEFPLLAALLAVAVPTLRGWRFWPKPIKPGHCGCGYDLTGLPEPRCPECGQPFESRGDAP